MQKFIIQTDGASRGNPGHAAVGFVIKTGEGLIWVQDGHYIGMTTNNVAEYTGVVMALERLIKDFSKFLPADVEFIADSQLVASQLAGKFKIKNENLKELYNKVKELERQVGKVTYTYTPRANNFLADKLANMALDAQLS